MDPVKSNFFNDLLLITAFAVCRTKHLKVTGAFPLLWTSNLMAPESYVLHDALEGYIAGESDEQVRQRAVSAYSKYQKISVKSANSLFVTGW